MARPGITKQEVFAAANRLSQENKDPTIDLIRQITKTGSHSTIAMHLRDWRAAQTDIQVTALTEGLPHEMVAMMKTLWQRQTVLSEQKAGEVETRLQGIIQELEQELQKYKTNNQRWQQMFNQWQQEKEKLAGEKIMLEEGVASLQREKVALQTKLDSQTEQLQEKQDRVNELNRLHSQAQANLEHYRESVREQRLIEQQQYDQQKLEMGQEVKLLKEQVILLREKAASTDQRYKMLQQNHTRLESESEKQVLLIEELKIKASDHEKNALEHHQASQRWETQYQEQIKLIEAKTAQLIESQYEVKLLTLKLDDSKQALAELQDQNKIISNDKWVLAQEKSILEGQLKQIAGSVC